MVYKAEVTFGTGTVTAKSTFDITVNAVMTLKGAGALEATKGTPLTLTIEGGTPDFSVDTDRTLAGTAVSVSGRTVTVTVSEPPSAATKLVVIVKDDSGRKGRRTITVR
ncbi:MAG: hypothetical protein QM736_22585 [Vicinamibacterales bacterium]